MVRKLLTAFEQKKRFGDARTWLTRTEAMRVLKDFKAGAARAFLEKLEKLSAFEYLPDQTGEDMPSVFRFTSAAEERLQSELDSLNDP